MKYTKVVKSYVILMLMSSALVGCATQYESELEADVDEVVVAQPGVPGGATIQTTTLVAQVTDINYDKRSITLKDKKGNKQSFIIGPDAVNFDQIQTGDQVKMTHIEEVVVYVKDTGLETGEDVSAAAVAARASEGEKPGGVVASTVEVTAVVTAVDLENHTAILRYPDGTTDLVAVREDVKLSEDQVGREVVMRISSAVAISVEKVN